MLGGGCVRKTRKRHAVRKMKEDPSKPPCRRRLQTALSRSGPKAAVVNVRVKRRDIRSRHVWIREILREGLPDLESLGARWAFRDKLTKRFVDSPGTDHIHIRFAESKYPRRAQLPVLYSPAIRRNRRPCGPAWCVCVGVCILLVITPFGSYAQRPVIISGYVYCEEKSHVPLNVQVDLRDAQQTQLASLAPTRWHPSIRRPWPSRNTHCLKACDRGGWRLLRMTQSVSRISRAATWAR